MGAEDRGSIPRRRANNFSLSLTLSL